jgi:3-oxoacyl-[acyl-carrier-protein] synthase-3
VGPAYAIGEECLSVTDVDGCAELFAERGVPLIPDVLGLGYFHQTRDVYALAAAAARQTIESAALAASQIDLLVVSSSRFRGSFDEQNKGLARACSAAQLAPREIVYISGRGCASALSALVIAGDLLDARGYENVLLINWDHMGADAHPRHRFLGYAFASDSAASILVTAQPRCPAGMRMVAASQRTDLNEMARGMRLDEPLGLAVLAELRRTAGFELADVGKVLSHNLFLPFKVAKERALGFAKAQMFLANTPRLGHCLASDALVNLADHARSLQNATPPARLLFADADGHAVAVLLSAEEPPVRVAPDAREVHHPPSLPDA